MTMSQPEVRDEEGRKGVENQALEVGAAELTKEEEGSIVLQNTAMGEQAVYTKSKGSERSPLLHDAENGNHTGFLKSLFFTRIAPGNDSTSFRISKVILALVFIVAGLALVAGLVFGSISFNSVEGEIQQDEKAMVNIAGVDVEELGKSSVGEYRFTAVAADAGPCSTVGTNMLAENGGSVVDAAIATLLCTGLHNAHSMGIGGGHFMVIYERPKNGKERKVYTLDSRESAPAGATRDMYKNGISDVGAFLSGVPGEIRGMHEAWKRFGRLPWRDLFQPAIRMARNGYTVSGALATAITGNQEAFQHPELGKTFSGPDGAFYKEGDIATRLKLADTLEVLAEEGPDAFYNGSLTDDIYNDIKDCGGIITRDDLMNYKSIWRKPSVTKLKSNLTVYTMNSPSSGPVFQYMLNVLEGYNFSKLDLATLERRVRTYHRLTETYKFGYARRSFLGDPAFVDVKKVVAELQSTAYADATRLLITDSMTHPVEYYHPAYKAVPHDGGTSHLSLVGPNGEAVSVTSTINTEFGCKCIGTRTGIIFNDEMSDFSWPGDMLEDGFSSTWANYIEPGKRPLSSMVPSIFLDQRGEPRLVLGASGGRKILSSTTLVAARVLFLGLRLNDAIDKPRLHHQLIPDELQHDEDFNKNVLMGLQAKGHVIVEKAVKTSVQGIWSTCGHCRPRCKAPCMYATSDIHKGGYPDGY